MEMMYSTKELGFAVCAGKSSYTDLTVFMPKCSGCQQVWYCNAECQRAHWKDHKQLCRLLTEDNASALANLGKSFTKIAEKWVYQNKRFLDDMASLVIKRELESSHLLQFWCDFSRSKGRAEDNLVAVESTEAVPLAFYVATEPQLAEHQRTMLDKPRRVGVVMNIYNADEPNAEKLISFTTADAGNVYPGSLEQLIAGINSGEMLRKYALNEAEKARRKVSAIS
jgi:hypothetical protein